MSSSGRPTRFSFVSVVVSVNSVVVVYVIVISIVHGHWIMSIVTKALTIRKCAGEKLNCDQVGIGNNKHPWFPRHLQVCLSFVTLLDDIIFLLPCQAVWYAAVQARATPSTQWARVQDQECSRQWVHRCLCRQPWGGSRQLFFGACEFSQSLF